MHIWVDDRISHQEMASCGVGIYDLESNPRTRIPAGRLGPLSRAARHAHAFTDDAGASRIRRLSAFMAMSIRHCIT